jgi:hypothetical protein
MVVDEDGSPDFFWLNPTRRNERYRRRGIRSTRIRTISAFSAMFSLPLLYTVALYFALMVLGAFLKYPSGYSIGLYYRPISPLDKEIRDIR